MGTRQNSLIARIALRGTVWVTLGNYAYQLIGFVALLYLRRLLEPAIFGLFDLAAFWVALLSVRNKIGLNYAALRQPVMNGAVMGTVFVLDLVSGLLSMTVILLAIEPLSRQFGYGAELALALSAIAAAELLAVFSMPASLALEKEMQISRNQLVTLMSYALGYAVAVLLAFAGYQLISLLSVSLVMSALAAVLSWITYTRRLPHMRHERWRFDPSLARQLLRDGLTTGLTLTLLTTIVSQFDNFLNATFISATMQGYYGNAYKIANWPNVLLTVVISRVGYSVMTRMLDDRPRLTHTVRLSLWLLCVLGGPLALTLGLGASDLIEVLYPGGKWAASAPLIQPLAATSLANAFMSVGYWLSVALGRRRFTIALAVTQAICLLLGGSLLVRPFGIYGTLIAVASASICGFVMSQWFVQTTLDMRLRDVYAVLEVLSAHSYRWCAC
ncbi:MAG: oligosaccharide flippase family protein [Chloroflexi bacterium]|nr:oligosaccharide flippase family protein [Chloroflexota bacterium]